MTREEQLDWLCRLRSEIYVYMPKEWLIYMNNALDMAIKALEQELTTKNDLAQERYQDLIEYFGDEKVTKTILEDRKEFKAWLERLRWNVKRADELARELEQIKGTTRNDLGIDCIDRTQAIERLKLNFPISEGADNSRDRHRYMQALADIQAIRELPSVKPQKPKIVPIAEIKYDEEKLKPRVAIDLISVIKQNYIEREVLDKIRTEIAEIPKKYPMTMDYENGLKEALAIIDKAKSLIDGKGSNL